MTQTINYIILLIVSVTLFLSSPLLAGAEKSRLQSIHIHVFINDDGSATITERRTGSFFEGTEFFHVLNNLSKSKVENFTVKEDKYEFEFVEQWSDLTGQEDKENKYGIIDTVDGHELVWGIGEY